MFLSSSGDAILPLPRLIVWIDRSLARTAPPVSSSVAQLAALGAPSAAYYHYRGACSMKAISKPPSSTVSTLSLAQNLAVYAVSLRYI